MWRGLGMLLLFLSRRKRVSGRHCSAQPQLPSWQLRFDCDQCCQNAAMHAATDAAQRCHSPGQRSSLLQCPLLQCCSSRSSSRSAAPGPHLTAALCGCTHHHCGTAGGPGSGHAGAAGVSTSTGRAAAGIKQIRKVTGRSVEPLLAWQ